MEYDSPIRLSTHPLLNRHPKCCNDVNHLPSYSTNTMKHHPSIRLVYCSSCCKAIDMFIQHVGTSLTKLGTFQICLVTSFIVKSSLNMLINYSRCSSNMTNYHPTDCYFAHHVFRTSSSIYWKHVAHPICRKPKHDKTSSNTML